MNELKDYIVIVDNALSHSLCDAILKEYAYSKEWKTGSINVENKVSVDKNKRNCHTIFISDNETIYKNFSIRKKIDEQIFKSVGKACSVYFKKFKNFRISKDSGYELLKYEKNGFFEEHVDSYSYAHRTLSCSLILNNNFEGGEFSFFNEQIIYSLKKGSAIFFPSNFMYPHSILPVKNGIRYSIVTWLV
jgi:predicted 2-oxoglutarate/Fe(II)-dependent dioxygenase YbiX